jgi:hypothetical protein
VWCRPSRIPACFVGDSVYERNELLGEALRNLGVPPESYLIATKAFGPMGKGPNDAGVSRGHALTCFSTENGFFTATAETALPVLFICRSLA